MKSRKFSLAALLISLIVFAPVNAAPVDVDMTVGTWIISATDDVGLSWDGSTINFDSQAADGDVWDLAGVFEWIGSSGASGGERFTGTLEPDRTLRLQGFELIDPVNIVLATYFAILDDTGNRLVDGNWTGIGIPSDDFSAVRVVPNPVPIPAALWLFGTALIGLVGIARKRNSA